jgi:hypothetical protein
MIHKTKIANSSNASASIVSLYESLPIEKQEKYGKNYLDYFIKIYCGIMERESWDPENVVNEIIHATMAKNPCVQYLQGLELLTFCSFINFFPRPINENLVGLYAGYHNDNLIPNYFANNLSREQLTTTL